MKRHGKWTWASGTRPVLLKAYQDPEEFQSGDRTGVGKLTKADGRNVQHFLSHILELSISFHFFFFHFDIAGLFEVPYEQTNFF